MTYRELLNRCKERPGWIRAREQQDIESKIRFMDWMEKLDEEYKKEWKNRKPRD